MNRSGAAGGCDIQLDAEGYREKREQSLQHLARKVAAKVTKYRRSVTLEPMNAYERHVIHTALQDVPGEWTTYLHLAWDPNRRVIVAYDRDQEIEHKGDRRSPFCDTARRGGLYRVRTHCRSQRRRKEDLEMNNKQKTMEKVVALCKNRGLRVPRAARFYVRPGQQLGLRPSGTWS